MLQTPMLRVRPAGTNASIAAHVVAIGTSSNSIRAGLASGSNSHSGG